MKSFSFVVVAGGGGSRIGGLQKQFRMVDGKPLWRWSVDTAQSVSKEGIAEIVLVLPKGCPNTVDDSLRFSCPFKIVSGGDVRSESVKNGLKACSCDYVMVHDAARPFVSAELIKKLMNSTTAEIGAIPVMPLSEAVKKISRHENKAVTPVDRDDLFATQTPQSFFRPKLLDVLERCGDHVKDEAEAWLAAGLELCCIEGGRLNFKVTWPEDLVLAESLIRNNTETRTGLGYDVHRLVPERALILGGVHIESNLGLLGHSDADVLTHTVADALLGAAGLPDIGNLFPASDEKYRDADSVELLKQVVAMVERDLWDIVWVDAVIEAQVPRLNTYIHSIRQKLSAILISSDKMCMNLKVKSPEKTGWPGAGRSMTCRAVATLKRCGLT